MTKIHEFENECGIFMCITGVIQTETGFLNKSFLHRHTTFLAFGMPRKRFPHAFIAVVFRIGIGINDDPFFKKFPVFTPLNQFRISVFCLTLVYPMKKLVTLFLLFSFTSSAQLLKHKLDSLFNYSGLDSIEMCRRSYQLGCIARDFNGSSDSAILILDRAYKIARELKSDNQRMRLHEFAEAIKLKNKNYAEAYEFAVKCAAWGKKNKNPQVKTWSLEPLIRFYSHLGSYDKLIETRRKKLKIACSVKDSNAIANTSYLLAYDLYTQKHYPESRQLFLDAYYFSPAAGKHGSGMAEYIGWAGNISNILKDYNAAVSYRLMAVNIVANSPMKDQDTKNNLIATSYRFIGSFYASRKMLDSAQYYFNLSLNSDEARTQKTGPHFESFDIARAFYYHLNNSKLAEPYISGVLDNKKINPYTDVYYWSVELGAKIYADLGDEKRLAYCTKWYFKIKDSIDKPQEVVAEDISMKYELEMQQKEKKTTAMRELEKRKAEIFKRNLFAGFAAIALLLLLVVYRNFRQKKKANKEITHQKMLVEEKQKEIVDSINYAKRIQQSQLPTTLYIERSMKRLNKNNHN
jgi:hypothetical protein